MAVTTAENAGSVSRLRARARLSLMAERSWGSRAIMAPLPEGQAREGSPTDDLGATSAAPGHEGPATLTPTDLFGDPPGKRQGLRNEGEFSEPPPARSRRIELLLALDEAEVRVCSRCTLAAGRTHTVFGEGDPEARLMFIGEGPGETEDATGRPFVGRAGALLDRMITGMGLRREDVYIANVVKCRPPNNRVPTMQEVSTCTAYLHKQIEWIRPQVIVTLGLPATRHLLKTAAPMGALRGRWSNWRGIKVMPTYHPAYLLRSYTLQNRRIVWEDLQKVMTELGLSRRKAGASVP